MAGTTRHRVQLGGDGLVGPERRRAEVPRPPVGVTRRQDRRDQGVQAASFGRRCGGIDGGPSQRVHERHPVRAGLDQACLLGSRKTLDLDAGHGARAITAFSTCRWQPVTH